jgi:hypothetical protein
LRPAAAQDQVQMLAIWSGFGNRILPYDAAVVFHIDIQVCTWNHAISQLQDFRKAIRSKPVIGIVADVSLQQGLFFLSGKSAAVDEVPDYVPNFSDVGMCGDEISIRQHKSRKPPGIGFECIL